jgi:two-component system, chemotaxis family, chemotaxis protein CheY
MIRCRGPVLLVDDQPKLGLLVTELLYRLGIPAVDSATNGKDALAMLREEKYALVISDLDMKPMSGLELLRAMRSDKTICDVPFILTETSITFDQVTLAHGLGADAFLLKPFDIPLFKKKLKLVLAYKPRRRPQTGDSPVHAGPNMTTLMNSFEGQGS